jgi:hypothetical protein
MPVPTAKPRKDMPAKSARPDDESPQSVREVCKSISPHGSSACVSRDKIERGGGEGGGGKGGGIKIQIHLQAMNSR